MGWQEFSFGSFGSPGLRGRLSGSKRAHDGAPIVMMLTGDGRSGSKSSTWTNLPPLLDERGIRTFLFDFQGLGDSSGERKTLTCSIAKRNLADAVRALRKREPSAELNFLAASFGATALLMSPRIAKQANRVALKSPASVLSLAYLSELGPGDFARWKSEGFSEVNGYNFEVFRDACRQDVYGSAGKISRPVLITHGTADEVVHYDQSLALSASLAGPVKLEAFEGVGHGYSEPGAWDRMASLYVEWFSER